MSMKTVEFSPRVMKAFRNLGSPKLSGQIGGALLRVVDSPPQAGGVPRVRTKKLRGGLGLRVAYCGEYRIVYEEHSQFIRFVALGKRNDSSVYRSLRGLSRARGNGCSAAEENTGGVGT